MTPKLSARIAGIGLWGPGMAGWDAGARALRSPQAADFVAPPLPQATMLPSAERRRATPSTRLALAVAAEAIAASGLPPSSMPSVFASSAGNPEIVDALCTAMAAGDFTVSPTRFHNSVHNAAAGYFGIGAANLRASTSLATGDAGAGVGLLEALVETAADLEPVLLVCVDVGYPYPMSEVRPMSGEWAAALVLLPDAPRYGGPRIDARIARDAAPPVPPLGHPALDHAVGANPTARLLPLLRLLALGESGTVSLPAGHVGRLVIDLHRTIA